MATATKKQSYHHWRLDTDANHVLWVFCDRQDAAVNTLNRAVLEEFSQIIEILAQDTTHEGVIITSGKANGFIAGADISQFTQLTDANEATQILQLGQQVFNQLAALKIPTVAMINGFCLGGGLELVLACRYRVAVDSPKTRIGLPEIKLGIHPGWGGTIRLPQLIGSLPALNLILTGQALTAQAAAKVGMVDATVPQRQLAHAACYYALHHPEPHHPSLLQTMPSKRGIRELLACVMRKKLQKKVQQSHYPAPYQVIDNWEKFGIEGEAAYTREASSCGQLFLTDTSKNLVRVFFLQTRLKSLAKSMSTDKQVHVIGAGTMGGDIAAWCALQGYTVTLQDLEPALVSAAIKRAHQLFTEKLKARYLVQKAMDRLIPDVDGAGIARADMIIEAVVEDVAIKQTVFKMIQEKARPDAILATNTSSIPLTAISTVLTQPERLVGIHFFNPVAKMQLVEVVASEQTSQAIIDQAMCFVRALDRLPLPVKSSPGFLVNRILMPYLLESMTLLSEGVPMWAVDKAMVDFGMPMGPITLADTVGLDVCLSVATYLGQYFGVPVPLRLTELVQQRKLGKKTGEGFYKYDKRGKQIRTEHATYDKPLEKLSNRLVARLVQEAFTCLQEGVVADGDLVDAGMIFGTGFAPFRGGPIHYGQTKGMNHE
jgi:3-hydroxyacyl-CoA dehydrogenase/enoyl-CoA hydratase/3-hydroxybutyryl-CoA epimerase